MRMIDGDALEEFLSDAEIEATKQKRYVFASALNVIQGNVRNFPTIEPEPKKGRWIPCGERLPKESNFYMVTNEYDEVEIIWFAHKDDYDIDKSEWRETEDKIIAWMPLPEPYMEDMKGKE